MAEKAPTRGGTDPLFDLVTVGGCHRDLVGRTDAAFEPGTSCPGRIAETAGGVARNVAVLAASTGLAVALASRVGDDAAGRGLLAGLQAAGVATGAIAIDPDVQTGTYVAIHDQGGELAAALSDLAVYDRMTAGSLDAARPLLAGARLVFADANLPAETLDALAAALSGRLAVDAISRAKAPRVVGALRAGALVFANRTSAEVLAGRPLSGGRDAAAALSALGARRAVVSCGSAAVGVLDDGSIEEVPVPPAEVRDVTGAGDALIAGTLAAILAGKRLTDAVEGGIAAARAALASVGALGALPASVVARLQRPA